MAYTEPPTFASATTATAADANILAEDIRFLKARSDALIAVCARVDRNGVSQSIPNNTWTAISFTRELFDQGGWIAVTSTDLTLPAAGIPAGYTYVKVDADAFAKFASNATGQRGMRVLRDGSPFVESYSDASNSGQTSMTGSMWASGISGSVFTMEVYQNSGGALDLTDCALGLSIDKPIS
jgi:hypothetical protein